MRNKKMKQGQIKSSFLNISGKNSYLFSCIKMEEEELLQSGIKQREFQLSKTNFKWIFATLKVWTWWILATSIASHLFRLSRPKFKWEECGEENSYRTILKKMLTSLWWNIQGLWLLSLNLNLYSFYGVDQPMARFASGLALTEFFIWKRHFFTLK